jgi:sugar phosphate isomerase/epimerase
VVIVGDWRVENERRTDMNLEFGVASDLFWDPLGEVELKAVADHGFSFMDIWGHVPWFDIRSSAMAAELKAMVEAQGLRIRCMHAPCEVDWDISSEDEAVRRKSVEEVILSIDRCRELDGEIVVIHPGREIEARGADAAKEHGRRIELSIRSFVDIIEAARDKGILVAVENAWANEVGGREEYWVRLMDTLDPKVAGICYDSSHANINPGSNEMIARSKYPIITTHLSDNQGQYDEHKPPFEGTVDWRKTLKLLLDKGFEGPWLLEIVNGGHDPYGFLPRMVEAMKKMRLILTELGEELDGELHP